MTIAQSLNKAYLKQDISITDYNRFIQALRRFFQSFDNKAIEENQKNTIAEFLRYAHYQDKFDLVATYEDEEACLSHEGTRKATRYSSIEVEYRDRNFKKRKNGMKKEIHCDFFIFFQF